MEDRSEGYEYHEHMLRCIDLALQAPPRIARPYVGAVVISPEGRVIGEGYKKFIDATFLTIHAERIAVDNAGYDSRGGALVTTLEPCVKKRRTLGRRSQIFSSCCDLIIENGIVRVVIGLMDKSDIVNSGKGFHRLDSNGIEVIRYTGLNDLIREKLMHPNF